jgi:hypothetical protein
MVISYTYLNRTLGTFTDFIMLMHRDLCCHRLLNHHTFDDRRDVARVEEEHHLHLVVLRCV